jgi:hypothetical protein
MTAGVLDRPVTGQFELDGGGTLEELLSSALAEARANGSTECPVCHARMSFTHAREAECSGCGSRLG